MDDKRFCVKCLAPLPKEKFHYCDKCQKERAKYFKDKWKEDNEKN